MIKAHTGAIVEKGLLVAKKVSDDDLLTVLTFLENGAWHPASKVYAAVGVKKNFLKCTVMEMWRAELIAFRNVTTQEFMEILKNNSVRALSFHVWRITDKGRKCLQDLKQQNVKSRK